MRPVAANFEVSQEFGGGATAGVVPNPNQSSGMGYYVWLYGNYQPYGHAGMDIATPIGTPIYAPADGEVLYAGWCEDLPGSGPVRKWLLYYNFGGIVTVTQHNGWISVIAHQSTNDAVYAGMQVKEGQLIGKTGNTKTRTTYVAAHVHIEALVYNDYRTDVSKGIIYGRVDPTPFFGGINVQGSTNASEDDELLSVEAQKWMQDTFMTKKDGAYQNERMFTKSDGAYMNGTRDDQFAALMSALDGKLDKLDGNYIVNLLKAVKPGQTDAKAVAEAIAALIPEGISAKEVADEFAARLGGK